jgi:subtilisin family serine protease
MRYSRSVVVSPGTVAHGDPLYGEQWAWKKMEAEAAWARLREAEQAQPTVAIVDWGIQRDHEDLNPELVSGVRVIPPYNGDFSDDYGHGTMLAGTIGAVANNDRGGRGAVPSARLMAVKFIDVRTPPMSKYAAKAIKCAVDRGAQIINVSWDVGLNSDELRGAFEYAAERGRLLVVAAGNDGSDNRRYRAFPASFGLPNMIVVMATDKHDQKPGFSNYGENVDLAAPGVDIVTTSPYLRRPPVRRSRLYNRGYRSYSGTSAAAAHISGAAALLLSIDERWRPEEIREHLIASVDPVDDLKGICRAGGRLNLRRAAHGPFEIAASRQGQDLVVEWSCNYRSRVVETASLSLVDCDSAIAVSLAQRLDTRGRRKFPVPNTSMARAFVRVECGERRLFTDCEPLCLV